MNARQRHGTCTRLLSVVLFCASAACSNDMIVTEDFERLDLGNLPEGWRVVAPGEVSIAEDTSGGKVLRIGHIGGGLAELNIPLNIDQVRGHKVAARVRAKCPIGYERAERKQDAPQLRITYVTKNGGSMGSWHLPPPTQRDWMSLSCSIQIPAEASGACVSLRVKGVVCEALFDDLTITVDGAPASVPGMEKPGTNAPPAMAGPHVDIARKTVQEHGVQIGPEVVASTLSLRRPGAEAKTFAVVGPAAPLKQLAGAPLPQWTQLSPPRELTGAAATMDVLFVKLPKFLADKKPEIVVLACASEKERKSSYRERHDWEDLARLCLRLGAVPILAIPPESAECPSRMEMLEAVKRSKFPALAVGSGDGGTQIAIVDVGVHASFPQRVAWLFGVLERHVCKRAQEGDPVRGAGLTEDDVE